MTGRGGTESGVVGGRTHTDPETEVVVGKYDEMEEHGRGWT